MICSLCTLMSILLQMNLSNPSCNFEVKFLFNNHLPFVSLKILLSEFTECNATDIGEPVKNVHSKIYNHKVCSKNGNVHSN